MRRLLGTGLVGALFVATLVVPAADVGAQNRFPVVGNGGFGGCLANGGAVGLGNVNSGLNAGSDIMIGTTFGEVDVDGGVFANSTDLRRQASGGLAACGGGGGFNFGFPF